MNSLRVWQKLLLIGLVFAIPFAVVTYQLVASVNTLGVSLAEKEILGTNLATPLRSLMRGIHKHRGAKYSVSLSSRRALSMQEAAGTVEDAIRGVDSAVQALNGVFPSTKDWAALKSDVATLLSGAAAMSNQESFEKHNAILSRIILMIKRTSDESNLTVDSDLDSSYLVKVLMFVGVDLTELVANARHAGWRLMSDGNGLDENRSEIQRLGAVIKHDIPLVGEALRKAMNFNASLRPKLDESLTASDAALHELMESIRRLSDKDSTDTTTVKYHEVATVALESVYQLQDKVAPALQTLLTERADRLKRQVRDTLVMALLGLLAVVAIGYYIMLDITRPLNTVVAIADRIAEGDLGVAIAEERRKDEIGELQRSFRRMVVSLQEMAGTASRIAGGDMAGAVVPQSKNDVMGNALVAMTKNLSNLVGQVQRSGIQVTSSVTEIAATAKQQQATANEIAATTTEIGATSIEISATSKELVRTIREVAQVAGATATLAAGGQAGLARMTTSINHISDASGSINAKLSILNEKATSINSVVTTITKVADQTNLLSLNAAIEAEKAGEYGRGFAVVATEIRRLADQTAVATYDIERIVQEMQSAVSAGVMGMDKFSEEVRKGVQVAAEVSEQLGQIIGQVQHLLPRFDEVAQGMQSQSEGAQQISQALSQLSDGVQQTVESLRQSNNAIEHLNDAVRGLQQGVSRFTLSA